MNGDPEDGAEAADDPDDRTVVRPAPSEPPEDATVVAPRDAAADETVVAPPRAEVDDATEPRTRGGGSVALPVEDPGPASPVSLSLRTASGPGLDPERRIAAIPDRKPWEEGPAPERGVRPGAPVVYGARSERLGDSGAGPDDLHRRLGDPPAARSVPVREHRPALPSVERRARRLRRRTLLGYAAAVLVAALGLWGVAILAFG